MLLNGLEREKWNIKYALDLFIFFGFFFIGRFFSFSRLCAFVAHFISTYTVFCRFLNHRTCAARNHTHKNVDNRGQGSSSIVAQKASKTNLYGNK